ncbi:MAG: hypothetical protein OXI17_09030 [Gammaproteobacteria bacterium]|nr:hypothetical protein [Gammaproteobacteria bacterium]
MRRLQWITVVILIRSTLHGGRGGPRVLAEIYPSLVEPYSHAMKDAGQVMAIATALRVLDQRGDLSGHLSYVHQLPAAVREEEALFLGKHDTENFRLAARQYSLQQQIDVG